MKPRTQFKKTDGRLTFPYPEYPKIVYEQGSTNPYWVRRRWHVARALQDYTFYGVNTASKTQEITNYLMKLSDAEESKEIALIEQFYGKGKNNSYKKKEIGKDSAELVRQINYILQGKTRFENLLSRIQDVLNRTATKESTKDKNGKKKTFKGKAPNMASVFYSYFLKYWPAAIEGFQNYLLTYGTKGAEAYFKKMLLVAVKMASVEMGKDASENEKVRGKENGNKSIFGGMKDWEEIHDNLAKINGFEEIADALYDKIGFSNVYADMAIKKESYNQENYSFISESRMKSVGGTIDEITAAPILNALYGSMASGKRLTSENTVLTDEILILEAEATISTPKSLIDVLDTRMGKTQRNLQYKAINEFVEEYREKLKNTFIIFVNNKNNDLGSGYKATSGVLNGKLGEANEILNQAGMGPIDGFMEVLYNSVKNAYFSGNQAMYIERLENILSTAAAKIMFDDWAQIGQEYTAGGPNAIHVFRLSDVYVPASVVYKAMAQGYKETSIRANANATIKLKPVDIYSIYDPNKWEASLAKGTITDINNEDYNNLDIKRQILEKWNEVYEFTKNEVDRNSTFRINFSLNLKSVLSAMGIQGK